MADVDAASLGLMLGAAATDSTTLGVAGFVTSAVIPPFIHLGHRSVEHAAQSFGVRVLLPGVFAGYMYWANGYATDDHLNPWPRPITVAFAGFVAAAVVDAVFLAREPKITLPQSTTGSSVRSWHLSPGGVAGTF
jgi:hypothetical protein